MKVINNSEVEQGSSEWLSFREGKITGTKLGKLFYKSRKAGEMLDMSKPALGYYELLAERLAEGTADDDGLSSSRERGHQLESEAIDIAEEQLGLKFERGGVWQLNDNHIESPDGYTSDLKSAIEVKCLSSARHLQSLITKTAPTDYEYEYLNYFIVNKQLETLYVFLYDPRFIVPKLQTACFEIKRSDVEEKLRQLEANIEETELRLKADIERLLR